MMKKSVSEEEFVKFFENNANKFNLNVLDDNQLNLDTIAESCGKNKDGIESGDVLKYIYNNLETKGKFNANYNFNKDENEKINIALASSDEFTYRVYCKDLVQRIDKATDNLPDIFNSNQKTRKPWWQHFIFVFSALTCTGIYWIIAGCQNKNGASDIIACLLPFDVSITTSTINNVTEKIGKLGFSILLGVLNALFLVLFVCSLVFSWTIFAQVIFGVATFQLAILPILFSIIEAKHNFQFWREEQTKNKIKGQAEKIYDWLDQTQPKEELLKNQKTNLNLYDNLVYKRLTPMLEQQGFGTNKNKNKNKNEPWNT